MSVIRGIELLAALHCGAVGLSHVLQHQAWAQLFSVLRGRGRGGVLILGAFSLAFGSLIVAFHPVWRGIPALLTAFGWFQVAKGVIYLCFPSVGLRRLDMISPERSRVFVWPGVFLVILAVLLVLHLYVLG